MNIDDLDDDVTAPREGVIECKCIKITQPIGTFYVGVLSAEDLIEISFSDTREYKEERLVESISGIQRPLKRSRVEELSRYVNTFDASFPTAVILSMRSEDAKFDAKTSTMRIARGRDVARVLDGQHRIAGLRAFRAEDDTVFEVNVTIFVDMEMESQALLFSTINLKQTQVDNSLVFVLFEYAKRRSPQRTCHTIARVLNDDEDGPFYRRVMLLGTATGLPSESLTQAAFVKPLLALISIDPDTDRDRLRRGKDVLIDEAQIRTKKMVFRKLFAAEEDDQIADVLSDYFSAVQARWPGAWNLRQKGLILNRTTGYRALMRFLPLTIFHLHTSTPSFEQFEEIFAKVRLVDEDFSPDNYKPGSSGEASLLRRLIANTGIGENAAWKPDRIDPDSPAGMRRWASELGITERRLAGLVEKHGSNPEEVRRALANYQAKDSVE